MLLCCRCAGESHDSNCVSEIATGASCTMCELLSPVLRFGRVGLGCCHVAGERVQEEGVSEVRGTQFGAPSQTPLGMYCP